MHRAPDLLGQYAGIERLAGRTPIQLLQHLRIRPDPAIRPPQVSIHPLPELAVPHSSDPLADQAAEAETVAGAMLDTVPQAGFA